MNQIIQASLHRNEFVNRIALSKQISNSSHSTEKFSQIETESEYDLSKKTMSTCDSIAQNNITGEHNILKCENTPQINQKMESLLIDEESFNLDEVLFNECDNLSHISENANSCEKWQEESIHSFIYEQKISEEEEERKIKEQNYFCLLKQFDDNLIIERIPEHIKNIIEKRKFQIKSLGPLKLQCENGHQWETKFDDLINQNECLKCNEIKQEELKKKQYTDEEAKQQENNDWHDCKYPKPCKECKKQQRLKQKKQKEENIRESNKYFEKLQQELYWKAVKLLSQKSNVEKQKIIRAFKETEIEVEKAAMNHSIRYCAKQSITSQDQIQQIAKVYKMLLLPEGALKQYVQSQQRMILRQEYKTYAKSIHPDKNIHPQCCIAFSKLKKFWVDIPKTIQIDSSSQSQK